MRRLFHLATAPHRAVLTLALDVLFGPAEPLTYVSTSPKEAPHG